MSRAYNNKNNLDEKYTHAIVIKNMATYRSLILLGLFFSKIKLSIDTDKLIKVIDKTIMSIMFMIRPNVSEEVFLRVFLVMMFHFGLINRVQ